MSGSPVVTLRLPLPLYKWFKEYTAGTGIRPTYVLRDLIEAIRDNRLVLLAEAPPRLINDGSVPESPVAICLTPR